MLEDHTQFVNDVSIIFIGKTDPTDPLKREQYWRHTLKTLVPYDLNVSDCMIARYLSTIISTGLC